MDIEVGEGTAVTDPLLSLFSCERAIEENNDVVVHFRRTWRERSRECCNVASVACGRACDIISFVISLFVWFGIPVIVWHIIVDGCHQPPRVILEDVNLRDMAVFQNSTDTPYLVRSEFSVNLTAWNPNIVPKCFSTFRRMKVSVDFEGQHIVQQEVPLGFGLKPLESRTVMLDLRSDGYPVKEESAWVLDFELRNLKFVGLRFTLKSRVMRNDRHASWHTVMCSTITRLLPQGNFSRVKFCKNLDEEEDNLHT